MYSRDNDEIGTGHIVYQYIRMYFEQPLFYDGILLHANQLNVK